MAHVFISYVHDEEDSKAVQNLAAELESYGINVWLDKNDIKPGIFWKEAIRNAIVHGDFFIICFSKAYHARVSTYVNEELILAFEELRKRPVNRAWFIPVLLDKCNIPDRDIGAGKRLSDIQYLALYEDWNGGINKLVETVLSEKKPIGNEVTDQKPAIKTLSDLGLVPERRYVSDRPVFREDTWYLPDDDLLGFVEIPAGRFWMGSDDDDEDAFKNEKPKHTIELPTFYLARYPVTVAQYRAFVDDEHYLLKDKDALKGIPNHPVVRVTWHDALAYCRWLDGKLRRRKDIPRELKILLEENPSLKITLPSEAEWEKAARGTDGRRYPWGELFDSEKANTSETNIGTTSTVGAFPGGASPYGILDMSGNVWEWTRSLWGKNPLKPTYVYPYSKRMLERENLDTAKYMLRVKRGGSFNYGPGYTRCAYRSWYDRIGGGGFRVAVSPFFNTSGL